MIDNFIAYLGATYIRGFRVDLISTSDHPYVLRSLSTDQIKVHNIGILVASLKLPIVCCERCLQPEMDLISRSDQTSDVKTEESSGI